MDVQMTRPIWYLASPYTNYEEGLEEAHSHICIVAAYLMSENIDFYCPIAHFHVVSYELEDVPFKPKDPHSFWMDRNLPFMEICHGLLICLLPGWEESRGIKDEIAYFSRNDKPIVKFPPRQEELEDTIRDIKGQERRSIAPATATATAVDRMVTSLCNLKRLLPVQERRKVNNEIEMIERMAQHITDTAGVDALEELLEGLSE